MRIFNEHTLHFKDRSQTLSPEDIEREFQSFFERCPYKTKYLFNPIYIRGKFLGFGQVWIDNPKVFRLLFNLDEHGEKRIERRRDPTWKKPRKSLRQAIDELDFDIRDSWADYMDREDEVREQYTPRIIEDELEPVVAPPSGFEFGATYVEEYPGYSSHILCCKQVPEEVTEKNILNKFKRFSSVKGYPTVTRSHRNPQTVFVNFAEGTHDGLFAHTIMRFVTIKDKKLQFNIAYEK
jgi:hypothetical protein